jgi:hypothetical protein
MPDVDLRDWGYAPGDYYTFCRACGERFVGDKRAWRCKGCAETQRPIKAPPVKDWLIRKNGLFYRPDRSGYTADVIYAGLYTEDEAKAEAHKEPHTMSAVHVSQFADQISEAGHMVTRFEKLI